MSADRTSMTVYGGSKRGLAVCFDSSPWYSGCSANSAKLANGFPSLQLLDLIKDHLELVHWVPRWCYTAPFRS